MVIRFSYETHVAPKCKIQIGFYAGRELASPSKTQKKVLQSTILATLDYRDILNADAAATTLKPLDAFYNSARQFIAQDGYRTHHCELYEKVITDLAI